MNVEHKDGSHAPDVYTRSSTLTTTTLLRLKEGDRINLPVGPDQELAGLMINTGVPGGVVCFSNSTELRAKKLIMYWSEKTADRYSVMFVDLFSPISGGLDGIDVCLMDANYPVTEPMLHGRPALPDRYGCVEIEGFLIRDATKQKSGALLQSYPECFVNLGEFETSAKFREAFRQ